MLSMLSLPSLPSHKPLVTDNKIEDEGAAALSSGLPKSLSLRQLDMRGKREWCWCCTRRVHGNSQQWFCLPENAMRAAGCKKLSGAQPACAVLTSLRLLVMLSNTHPQFMHPLLSLTSQRIWLCASGRQRRHARVPGPASKVPKQHGKHDRFKLNRLCRI